MKLTSILKITRKECHWLERDIEPGEEMYLYSGQTYGCISPDGVAASLKENETPFFEIPMDSVRGE